MAIATRSSGATRPNPALLEVKGFEGNNLAFVRHALRQLPVSEGQRRQLYFVLLGSCDLLGVSLRQAQAILRRDLRPSLWSHAFAFVLPAAWAGASLTKLPIRGVPLDTRSPRLPEPAWNGITETTLGHYDDPRRDANVAVVTVELPPEQMDRVVNRFYRPNDDRVRYDLWSALCTWQQYYWSFGTMENPFRTSVPMPAAAFIEYCYDAVQLDLTPAATERIAAPEILWISAKYWQDAYAERGTPIRGVYTIRDPGCCVLPPDERKQPTQRIR